MNDEIMKIKNGKRMIMQTLVVGVALLALAIVEAKANPISISLNVPDTGISAYPGPYASVEVSLLSSTNASFSFKGLSNGGYGYLLGTLGVNVNASGPFSVSGTSYTTGSGQQDSFGSFNLVINGPNGSSKAVSSITFSLTDSSADWTSASDVLTPNTDGYSVAAHIYVFTNGVAINGATGFAGNGNSPSVPDGGTTAVMLGAALAGLGFVVRRVRK